MGEDPVTLRTVRREWCPSQSRCKVYIRCLYKSSSGHLELGHNVKELCSGLSPTVSRKTNNNTQNMLSKWDMRVETIKLDVINST